MLFSAPCSNVLGTGSLPHFSEVRTPWAPPRLAAVRAPGGSSPGRREHHRWRGESSEQGLWLEYQQRRASTRPEVWWAPNVAHIWSLWASLGGLQAVFTSGVFVGQENLQNEKKSRKYKLMWSWCHLYLQSALLRTLWAIPLHPRHKEKAKRRKFRTLSVGGEGILAFKKKKMPSLERETALESPPWAANVTKEKELMSECQDSKHTQRDNDAQNVKSLEVFLILV